MATVRQWLASMFHCRQSAPHSTTKWSSKPRSTHLDDSSPPLSPQQQSAVDRGATTVRRYGGVVLADAVGLGKTRVAVAMARRIVSDTRRRSGRADPALFAVPARLRDRWREAIGAVGWQCGRDARLVSHHRLSRQPWEGRPSVIVVDEAHRFRNPSAKRSRHLAKLTAQTPPILVTATPVCTHRRDLFVLLGYFLTDPVVESLVGMGLQAAFEAHEAGQFDIAQLLQEVIIRRRRPDFGASGRPDIHFELLRYRASQHEKWLWKNLEQRLRHMHFAATGDHWPPGLLVNNLLRLWESGAEALRHSLRDLIDFHDRWLDAADSGRRLERPDFLQLFGDVDRRQQVFPFVYGDESRPDDARRNQVLEDRHNLRELLERTTAICNKTPAMHRAIIDAVTDKPDQKFLIFAAYRNAARGLFDTLAASGLRVGLITGDDARATGLGAASDRELLERFHATDDLRRKRHHRLRILVATDCLSEGINLQCCSNVILADLPYSPVKLEQRIGRIARPNSEHRRVTVYLPRPRCWTDSLGLRTRITHRLKTADDLGASQTLLGSMNLLSNSSSNADKNDDPGPLAAMTLEYQLQQQLADVDTSHAPPHGAVRGTSDQTTLWARLRIRAQTTRHQWLSFSDNAPEPTVRLSEQIPGLARLADDRRDIESRTPNDRHWRRLQQWMQRRRAVLRAARLSPPLLGADAAPTNAWKILRRAVRAGKLNADADQLDQWRRRLLQAHPPGIDFELNELMETDCEPQKLVQFVEELAKPPPQQPIEIDVIGTLVRS